MLSHRRMPGQPCECPRSSHNNLQRSGSRLVCLFLALWASRLLEEKHLQLSKNAFPTFLDVRGSARAVSRRRPASATASSRCISAFSKQCFACIYRLCLNSRSPVDAHSSLLMRRPQNVANQRLGRWRRFGFCLTKRP